MVSLKLPSGKSIYLHKGFCRELDVLLYGAKYKDQDVVIVIDGAEGSGKTHTAKQVAAYCSIKMSVPFDYDGMTNIHNDIDKYIKSSIYSPKKSIHILDEGRKILNRKRSMGEEAVRFTNYLSECRDLNQIHIICIPAFHDLDRNVAQWRLSFVIHMIKKWKKNPSIKLGGYELLLGEYKLYMNNAKLRQCYDYYGFAYPKQYTIYSKINSTEVLSSKGLREYYKQKGKARKEKYMEGGVFSILAKLKESRLRAITEMTVDGIIQKDQGRYLGVSERTVRSYVQELKKKGTVFTI